jgi:hypothetical protein
LLVSVLLPLFPRFGLHHRLVCVSPVRCFSAGLIFLLEGFCPRLSGQFDLVFSCVFWFRFDCYQGRGHVFDFRSWREPLVSHPDLLKHAGPFLFLSIFQAGRRYLRFSLELSSSVSRSAPSRSTRAVFPAVKRAVRPGAPLLSVRALASISCSPRQRFCCQFSVCGLPCLTISSLLDFLSQGFGPRVLNVFSPARLISGLPSGARAGLRPVSHADIIFSLPIRILVLSCLESSYSPARFHFVVISVVALSHGVGTARSDFALSLVFSCRRFLLPALIRFSSAFFPRA